MDRVEAERRIFEKALEIRDICEAYNPGQEFFELSIHNDCISFFNEYWDDGKDIDAPLNFFKELKEDSDE